MQGRIGCVRREDSQQYLLFRLIGGPVSMVGRGKSARPWQSQGEKLK